MARQIVVELVGDSRQLSKSFDKAGASAREAAGDFDAAADKARDIGESFDRAEEGAGTLEKRGRGLNDAFGAVGGTMEGVSQIASGDLMGGLMSLGSTIPDIGGALGDLIIPLAKNAAQYATTAAAAVASSATQVGAWVALGVQSTLHAAKIAAAWLIAMGPIALVIAAVVGVVALIVANFDRIKGAIGAAWDWVRNTTASVWNAITGFIGGVVRGISSTIGAVWTGITTAVSGALTGVWTSVTSIWGRIVEFIGGLPGRIGRAASGMWDGIWSAFRGMLNAIVRAWNGIEFRVPRFEVGPVSFGGFTVGLPNLPYFHQGGVVPGTPGSDVLAVLQAGERVIPNGRSGSTIVINIESFVGSDRDIDKFADRLAMRLKMQGL